MPPKRTRAASVKKTNAPEIPSSPEPKRSPEPRTRRSTAKEPEQEHGYEFLGPPGAIAMTLGLPLLIYIFAFACNDVSGCPAPALLNLRQTFTAPMLSRMSGWWHGKEILKQQVGWPGWSGLINVEAAVGTLGWYVFSLAMWALLPAYEAGGTELRTGGRLEYRLNSFFTAVVILVACAAGTWVLGPDFQLWTFINRNYLQILTSNVIIAYALATFVYLRSYTVTPKNKEKRELAAGGHSGNMIYDWFIGRELNPRIVIPGLGEVDIKSFMELRPGMIGWLMLDLAFMAKQYKSYGYLSDSMILLVFAQSVYVLDALYSESAILTTIDITTDGFGFMLSFGDLVWVPFIFSLQARYLAVHPVQLGPAYVLLILVVQGVGYYIFRASNSEKNRFRTNPDDPANQHLSYIQTHTGSKLLTSGWWGRARHINYLGDWVMSWSYCLPTLLAGYKLTPSILYPGTRLVTTEGMKGWAVPITYFYMVYFAVLLIHRERRDEEKCKRKYGKDWDEYCRQVPSRIIPGIY